MHHNKANQLLAAAALVLTIALVSCVVDNRQGPQPVTLEDTAAATTTPPEPAAPTDSSGLVTGPCEHLLWPLRDGATWSYRLSTPSETMDLTLTASVNNDGATLTVDGQTAAMYCGAGALAGLPPLPAGDPELGSGVTGVNPSGDYLPSPGTLLPLGQIAEWDQQLDAGGTILLPFAGSQPLPITGGRLVLVNETSAQETITVPAGDFLVLPVRQDVFFDVQVTQPDGSQAGIIINASAHAYFAEGVGLIRINYEGGTISSQDGAWMLNGGSTLELTGTSLP